MVITEAVLKDDRSIVCVTKKSRPQQTSLYNALKPQTAKLEGGHHRPVLKFKKRLKTLSFSHAFCLCWPNYKSAVCLGFPGLHANQALPSSSIKRDGHAIQAVR